MADSQLAGITAQRLKIFELSHHAVLTAVQGMLERADKKQMVKHARNDSILPSIVRLTNHVQHLSLSARLNPATSTFDFSHCWALCGGRSSEPVWLLAEGGTGQHPRLTVEGAGGEKIQAYHLTFYAALLCRELGVADPTLQEEFSPDQAAQQLDLLRQVSRKNTKATTEALCMTVAHLCGNVFCVRPSHLRVVPKRINEEHTCCHFMQSSHRHSSFMNALARGLCPHSPKCVFLDYHFE